MSSPLLIIAWKGSARLASTRQSARTSQQMRRPEASACRLRMQPTSSCATKLTWIGNFIARWTSLSVCNDSAGAKQCRLLSTSIWEEEDRFFTKQSQEVLCFQWQRYGMICSGGIVRSSLWQLAGARLNDLSQRGLCYVSVPFAGTVGFPQQRAVLAEFPRRAGQRVYPFAAFAEFAVSVAVLAWIDVSESTKWEASSLLPFPATYPGHSCEFLGFGLISCGAVFYHERFFCEWRAHSAVFLIRGGPLELAEARLGRMVFFWPPDAALESAEEFRGGLGMRCLPLGRPGEGLFEAAVVASFLSRVAWDREIRSAVATDAGLRGYSSHGFGRDRSCGLNCKIGERGATVLPRRTEADPYWTY